MSERVRVYRIKSWDGVTFVHRIDDDGTVVETYWGGTQYKRWVLPDTAPPNWDDLHKQYTDLGWELISDVAS